MRLGLIGDARQAWERFPAALDLLLKGPPLDAVVYMGPTDHLPEALHTWCEARLGDWAEEDAFLSEVACAAMDGSTERLRALLEREDAFSPLFRLQLLPSTTRAVELLGDRVLLLVRELDQLDEEDIASAHVVAFGSGPMPELRRFGPRSFYTPGRLLHGHVGLLEVDERGCPWATTLRLDGQQTERQPLGGRRSRVVLSS